MKYTQLFIASLCLGAAASYAADARPYWQLSFLAAESDGLDLAIGGSTSLGLLFSEKHAFEIEYSQFSVDDNTAGYDDYYGLRYASSVDFKFKPLLVNYRYEFPISEKIYGMIGGSVGVTFQKVSGVWNTSTPVAGNPSSWAFSSKDEALTVGYSVGLGYRLSDTTAVVLSAKTLRMSDSDVYPDDTFTMLQLGWNRRF
jgi:hypothetical protein